MDEKITEDRSEPGLKLFQMHGAPGYQMEHISVENTLSNGLRIQIMDDGDGDEDAGSNGWWAFHIESREAAELIARKLLEFARDE